MVGSGGSIPRGAIAGVHPFLGGRLCIQKYDLLRLGLRDAIGDYGLPLHHPRFIEWIGDPQSAGLIEISGAQWVNKLSRDQAVAVAVQRDVELMQTNVDVLDQYTLSLQKTASRMIELCLGSREFPVEDVAAGALGHQVRRVAVQMEAMELWRPSLDQLRLH